MSKKEKVVNVRLDEKEKPEPPKPSSVKKKEFEAIIAAYKKQNPVKYEQKKEALKAKLKNL